MRDMQFLLLVLILAASVQLTRFLPFAVFRNKEKLPATVAYLGNVLPAAMMGLLVVYCFKDYDYSGVISFLPALAATVIVAVLQLWRKNTILSIAAGTVAYMLMIRI